MNVKQTLADLVRIDSVSSRSNADIVDYLERRCEALKLKTQRFSYQDEHGLEKINLIALAGTDFSQNTNVEVALVGHTDTVPFDPKFSRPIGVPILVYSFEGYLLKKLISPIHYCMSSQGLRGDPPWRISKCRCAPWELPVLPAAPTGAPAEMLWHWLTEIELR